MIKRLRVAQRGLASNTRLPCTWAHAVTRRNRHAWMWTRLNFISVAPQQNYSTTINRIFLIHNLKTKKQFENYQIASFQIPIGLQRPKGKVRSYVTGRAQICSKEPSGPWQSVMGINGSCAWPLPATPPSISITVIGNNVPSLNVTPEPDLSSLKSRRDDLSLTRPARLAKYC